MEKLMPICNDTSLTYYPDLKAHHCGKMVEHRGNHRCNHTPCKYEWSNYTLTNPDPPNIIRGED